MTNNDFTFSFNPIAHTYYISEIRRVLRFTAKYDTEYTDINILIVARYKTCSYIVNSYGPSGHFVSCNAKCLNNSPRHTEYPYDYKIADDNSYFDIFLESTWSFFNVICTSIGSVNVNLIPWYDPDE